MRIKQGFMLREVANNFIVVPVGKASEKFRGLITLNSTGAFLWRNLEQETTKEELVKKLLEEFEVDKLQAEKDVNKYMEKLTGADLIE